MVGRISENEKVHSLRRFRVSYLLTASYPHFVIYFNLLLSNEDFELNTYVIHTLLTVNFSNFVTKCNSFCLQIRFSALLFTLITVIYT